MTCAEGEGCSVVYQFSDSPPRKYVSEVAPVDVQTSQGSRTIQHEIYPHGATFHFHFYRFDDYEATESGIALLSLNVFSDGRTIQPSFLGFDGVAFQMQTPIEAYLRAVHPLIPSDPIQPPVFNPCTIQVYYKGELKFSDQGRCPCTYEIKCDCEQDEWRVPSEEPPGYECIPVKELRQRMTQVRGDFKQQTHHKLFGQ